MGLVAAEGIDDADLLSPTGIVLLDRCLTRVLNDYHELDLGRVPAGPDGDTVVLQASVTVVPVDLVTAATDGNPCADALRELGARWDCVFTALPGVSATARMVNEER
ncbi:hypothetical protein OG802_34960 [Streptomyces sp. NBC_00704]|uniref:hypothetical protein n=1 Tax=Streptomyces sp. NBC_00704 TaxID=2975809 RepID=UPI002E36DFE6|nr:hypothetical protein [Streptomyces sp. NBC_00704]